jgi:hypothetical protein
MLAKLDFCVYVPRDIGSSAGRGSGHYPGASSERKIMMQRYPERFFSRVWPSNANRIRDFLRVGSVRPDERCGGNYIVVRHSPDWLSFDPESSRALCVKCGMPETLVIDIMAVWDAAVAVDFRQFRLRLKEIAQQTLLRVEGGRIIDDAAFRALALAGDVPADALVVFIDDDDWLAPHLFTRLRELTAAAAGDAGFKWGPARLGRDFNWSLDADANFALRPTITLRPIDRIYTNNYAVSSAALRRLGIDAVCEAFSAQVQFESGRFKPDTVAQYLSCIIRHPASPTVASVLLGSEDFRRDPRADISRWSEGVMGAPLPVDLAWMASPRDQLAALLADAARLPSRQ